MQLKYNQYSVRIFSTYPLQNIANLHSLTRDYNTPFIQGGRLENHRSI